MCQKAFGHVAQASTSSICDPKDMRGRHTNRPRKTTNLVKKQVKDHIKSFPAMKSHYSQRKNERRHYLSPVLSVAAMHHMYVDKHEGGADKPLVKYHYYLKVFNDESNLSFGYPKSDTCGTCEQFMTELSSLNHDPSKKWIAERRRDEYLRSAEKFYSNIRLDMEMAKKNARICTMNFDFQQNLPLPHLPVGNLFYMQQLWVHVFGIHNCGDDVTMYCWPETVAKRGSTVLSVNYRKTSHLSVCIRMGSVSIIQCHVHAFLGRVPLSLISEKKGKGHTQDNPADPKILPKSDSHVHLSHSTTEAGTAHTSRGIIC